MEVFMVRHGEMGRTSGNDFLTARGEEQALATGRYFSQLPVTGVISSPLVRALGTAHVIARACEDMPVEVWPELREGLFNEMTGYGAEELRSRFPLAWFPKEMEAESLLYPADTRESLLQRSQQVAQKLESNFGPNDTVVLVAHGGIISYIFHALLGIPADTFSFFKIDFASISQVSLIPPEMRLGHAPIYPERSVDVVTVGNTAHLVGIE
ncbi:histidine phosphatase family protein [Dictyobacter formicarum]|uniref:Alpha-ribazole phosphatase n=1 Tax=Dictyobacter formicarum TaxID=2778368 RepID=A0ABQ3VIJ3_9CHLR|nr:histidine phosphatase family protein [Dictyobacter formicarum]GHO85717.1 alpha-ribazole phosphatase [Dictyobacter formicarum]